MEELRKTLEQVRARILAARSPGAHRMTEQETKTTLIGPVLRTLGWDVEDVRQVRYEFRVKRMAQPVDYALLLRNVPRLLIEAKAIGENVEDDKWAGQIMSYAGVVGAPWIVLTNGDRWKIYRAGVDLPLDEKLFRSLSVLEDGLRTEQSLALLARESLQGSVLDETWEEERIDRQVERVVRELFDPTGDLTIANAVRKRIGGLNTEQVRASLSRAHISIEFPEVIRPQLPPPPPPGNPDDGPPEITVGDLIRARLLAPPVDLVHVFRGGKEVRARIEPDGRVRFGDQIVDSLSGAGALAKASVRGKVRGKLPSVDGWTFWRFIGENGKATLIDEKRQALRQKRAH